MIDYESIKHRVSISDILHRYGIYSPDATSFKVLCPFHTERTASLSVDENKGLFYCFGCGASGSVIDLTARLEKISPREAAIKLSSEFSIGEITNFKYQAIKTYNQVNTWTHKRHVDSIDAPYELRDLPPGYRNLSKASIDHFSLSLTDHGVYFPIHDLEGHTVGYSIRRPDGVVPKYLNSKGIPKEVPYGLYQNKDEIIKRGFAIVTEGQIDCVTCWDRGYRNVVAAMGSSLTDPQAYSLLRYTTRLVLLFDGDKPGRIGAARTNRRWSKCFLIRVELLPAGIDPAEWLAEKSTSVSASGSWSDNLSGAIRT